MHVDIYAGTVKQGSGPITTATGWSQTTRLDRIGQFSFRCSGSDPQTSLLAARRVAMCYDHGDLVGAGLIDSIQTTIAPDGTPVVTVSGQDLAQELTLKSVGNLSLTEAGWSTSVGVSQLRIDPQLGTGSQVTDRPLAYDRDEATYDNVQNEYDGDTNGGYVWQYVGGAVPFNQIQFVCSAAVGSTRGPWGNGHWGGDGAQFFNGTYWQGIVPTSDTTMVGGESFRQSGIITFALGYSAMRQTTEQGVSAYYIRGRFNQGTSNVSSVRWNEVKTWGRVPTDTALSLITATLPAGWSFDTTAGLSATVNTQVYLMLHGENCFEALSKLAEATGEHFYCTSERKIVWLGATIPSSGIRAINPPNPDRAALDQNLCLIKSISYRAESADMLTRVYPYGAGTGEGQLTLEQSVKTPPSGYTVNKALNYVEITGATPVWERGVPFKDIGADTSDLRARQHSAGMLQDAAISHLIAHRDPIITYDLSVVALARGAVRPGWSIWVSIKSWYGGFLAGGVEDSDLIVIETTEEIGVGEQPVGLVISTQPLWPLTDAEVLARAYRLSTDLARAPQPVGIGGVRSASFASGKQVLTTGAGGLAYAGSNKPS